MHAIILAGGGGTRLWPLSRDDFPKQFLSFDGKGSLLQKTVQRIYCSKLIDKIIVVTNAHHEALVVKQLASIDINQKVHILVEPCRRNTAPAIALAIKFLQENLNVPFNASILVLPSDHLIDPEPVFIKYIEHATQIIKINWIVAFGIQPTKPETGYGYIQKGSKLDAYTYRVKHFIEKPDSMRAQSYLASGDYFWNAGVFAFSIEIFWRELKKHAFDIFVLMQERLEEIKKKYDLFPNVSIDYSLMEKTDQMAMCPLPISWSDVGSWDSIYDFMDKDQNQNVKIGNVLDIDTKNSLIFGGKRLISTIGLEDVLIVETDDVIFISKKGESQRVKSIVQELYREPNDK